MNFAVYVRKVKWQGRWRLAQSGTDRTASLAAVRTLLQPPEAAGAEAAAFELDRPAPQSFSDGNEPGKLIYQITGGSLRAQAKLRRETP